jgi:hypothetical protein
MIQPVAYRKSLEGKSNAHLITFNDGRDYVVKYFQPEFENAIPNEWIAYCLARFLGLPIPFSQLVEIPQDFSYQVPQLSELARMSASKYQFASSYVPDCVNAHRVSTIPNILNHKSLAGIILFDYWLCNRDRTRKNILLREEYPSSYRLWIIDHSEVFGSFSWLPSDLEMLPTGILKSATHQLMARLIENECQFNEQLEIIQMIPTFLLEEIVFLIPDDWPFSKDQRKDIINTLVKRRNKTLPQLLYKFIKNIYRPLHTNF